MCVLRHSGRAAMCRTHAPGHAAARATHLHHVDGPVRARAASRPISGVSWGSPTPSSTSAPGVALSSMSAAAARHSRRTARCRVRSPSPLPVMVRRNAAAACPNTHSLNTSGCSAMCANAASVSAWLARELHLSASP
jgi:hypothetical protein